MEHVSNVLVVMDPEVRADEERIQRSLVRAMKLADRTRCHLELLLVTSDPAIENPFFVLPSRAEAARRSYADEQFRWLDDIRARLERNGYDVSCEVRVDRPEADAIVRKVTEAKPDLVVKHPEHHAFKIGLFGNTDWDLVRRCPAPLLFSRKAGLDEGKPVLVGVDPTRTLRGTDDDLDDQLIRAARHFSVLFDGPLHVLHTYQVPRVMPGYDGYMPMYPIMPIQGTGAAASPVASPQKNAEDRLAIERRHGEVLEAFARRHDLEFDHVKLAPGPAHEMICREADAIGAGLIVMGALERSRLDRVLLDVDAEPVLAGTECDVLFLKPASFMAPDLHTEDAYVRSSGAVPEQPG